MRKEYPAYGLPVDTIPERPRLRHWVDFETLRVIIHRIENKTRKNMGNK